MIIDNLTEWVSTWAAFTVVAIIVIAFCDGCCIKKALGKPCKK